MEELFKQLAARLALAIEGVAAVVIVIGATEAFVGCLRALSKTQRNLGFKREVWMHFARWLVIALEFELAADIIRTAISPTWTDLGQLATIAAIRTFLNYTLELDIEKLNRRERADERGRPKATVRPIDGPVR